MGGAIARYHHPGYLARGKPKELLRNAVSNILSRQSLNNTEAGLHMYVFKAVEHLHANLSKLLKHINPTDVNRN